MNEKQLQEAFIQFLAQKSGAKNEQELQQYIQSLGEEGLKQAQTEFMQMIQSQSQKAAHGAKLQYFKKLKNICNEDEELVYFKRGGSVDCGCVKKKMEDGGKTPTKKKSAIDNFKNRKQDQATKDSIAVNKYNDQEIQDTKPGSYKKNKQGKMQWTPDRTKAPYKKEEGGKIKKDCGGVKMKLQKKGGEVCPKCGKVHAAGMGCAVAKFKMHRQGGSLNGTVYYKKNKI